MPLFVYIYNLYKFKRIHKVGKPRSLFIGYIVLGALHLLGFAFGWEQLVFFTKPVLLLLLMVIVALTPSVKHKNTLLLALLFSWLGDTFLLFQSFNELFFILGLSAFFLAHVFYIFLFKRLIETQPGQLFKFMIIGLVVSYLVLFLYLLTPYLDDMLIPVYAYGVIISLMLYFAFMLFKSYTNKAGLITLFGALLFTASDSILGVNKFHEPVPYAGISIMLPYILAQGAIVWGILSLLTVKIKLVK